MTLAQYHQTALKKPAVYSPKAEMGQRWDVLRVRSIIEVLSVLARHTPLVLICQMHMTPFQGPPADFPQEHHYQKCIYLVASFVGPLSQPGMAFRAFAAVFSMYCWRIVPRVVPGPAP